MQTVEEKLTYIVQSPTPLGIENPVVNLPIPNKPGEFSLTQTEVTFLRSIVPNIKIVAANTPEDPAPVVEATPTSVEVPTQEPVVETVTVDVPEEYEQEDKEEEEHVETPEDPAPVVEAEKPKPAKLPKKA